MPIHVEHGLTTNYPGSATIIGQMPRHAKIVVADHRKIGAVGTALICPLNDVDILITDKGVSTSYSTIVSWGRRAPRLILRCRSNKHPQSGPTLRVPPKRRNGGWDTAPLCIICVVDQFLSVLSLQNGTVPRPSPATAACHDERTATIKHGFAASIHVWPSDASRAPHANVVGAVFSTTTEVERNKEVVVVILANDGGSFNCAWQVCCPGPTGQRV